MSETKLTSDEVVDYLKQLQSIIKARLDKLRSVSNNRDFPAENEFIYIESINSIEKVRTLVRRVEVKLVKTD